MHEGGTGLKDNKVAQGSRVSATRIYLPAERNTGGMQPQAARLGSTGTAPNPPATTQRWHEGHRGEMGGKGAATSESGTKLQDWAFLVLVFAE